MKWMFFFFCLSSLAFAKPSNHMCKALTLASCELEVSLICPEGYIDGCLTGQTQRHRCVLAQHGPSCELDIAILCPQNFRDGCELGTTTTHDCVPVRGPDCRTDMIWECPSGFTDGCTISSLIDMN